MKQKHFCYCDGSGISGLRRTAEKEMVTTSFFSIIPMHEIDANKIRAQLTARGLSKYSKMNQLLYFENKI